jgi:hypothetical protein
VKRSDTVIALLTLVSLAFSVTAVAVARTVSSRQKNKIWADERKREQQTALLGVVAPDRS